MLVNWASFSTFKAPGTMSTHMSGRGYKLPSFWVEGNHIGKLGAIFQRQLKLQTITEFDTDRIKQNLALYECVI